MMKHNPKFLSGLLAVGIYFGIIALVFYYFAYHSKQAPKHYVTQNAKSIAVSLSPPRQTKQARKTPRPARTKPPETKRSHTRPKPIVTKKTVPIRPKPKRKPTKKVKAKSLFAHVKTGQKSHPKSKPKKAKSTPSSRHRAGKTTGKSSDQALKQQKARDKGIENRYLAGVQNKLYGWPTQSNFAGATFTIGLTIYPDGRFEYVVIQPSSNPEFNRTIRQYLAQLKSSGFGPTPHGKKYEFKVEIVAK